MCVVCFVGIFESHDLGDTEAAGTAEVSGGASETTTGIYSAATSQNSGTSGRQKDLAWENLGSLNY
jgi:hypothetical protein